MIRASFCQKWTENSTSARLTILVVAFTRMAESFEQGRNVAFDHLLVAKKRCRTFGKRSGQELCRFSINWWRLVLQGLQAVFLNRFDAKTRVKGIYSFNQSRNDVGLLLLELLQDDRERLRGAVLELQKMISFNCQCIASQWDVKPYNLFCLGIPSFFIIKMGQPLPHFCYFCLIHNLMTNTASIKTMKRVKLRCNALVGLKTKAQGVDATPQKSLRMYYFSIRHRVGEKLLCIFELVPHPSPKSFSKSCEALCSQRDQHNIGILGNKLLENSDEIVVVAWRKFWVLRQRQECVEGLFARLPLLFFHLWTISNEETFSNQLKCLIMSPLYS